MGLIFAMGPVHLDTEGAELRARFGAQLGERLGEPVEVLATRSYAELSERMSLGAAHLGWMPPAVFVRAETSAGLRLLTAIERSLGDGYRGVLFVPRDSAIHSLAELAGARMAWVDRDSSAGYLFVRHALRAAGFASNELFRDERFEGSHGAVVRAVLRGDADAGATHAQTRPRSAGAPDAGPEGTMIIPELQLREGRDEIVLAGWAPYAGADGMRPLLISAAIPADVICASKILDPDRLDAVREALLHLHETSDDPDLLDEVFGGARLVPASTLDYDPVREAVR